MYPTFAKRLLMLDDGVMEPDLRGRAYGHGHQRLQENDDPLMALVHSNEFTAMTGDVMLGTAGWSIPAPVSDRFPGEGAHLERYARVMSAVEINSSFYRPHKLATYQRWAASVPAAFRFAVKIPKIISHVHKLANVHGMLEGFATETAGLGEKLEVVLLQLPPSFAFDRALASSFFAALKRCCLASLAIEPRHASWFTHDVDAFLADHQVARVAADPVIAGGDAAPGGWPGLHYRRLHGAPRTYYSPYDTPHLQALADTIGDARSMTARQWCIFDNTASGAALPNAETLRQALTSSGDAIIAG
jgi:uncharacterized protein YecE (DUF72 family)